MKRLIGLILLLPLTSLAAERHEVLTLEDTINVYNLHCKTRLGSNVELKNRERTVLNGLSGENIVFPDESFSEIGHTVAVMQGCPLTKLNKFIDASFRRFSHMPAKIELVKDQTKSGINGFKECVATYTETATLDFGDGIVLVSQNVILKKQNDCN